MRPKRRRYLTVPTEAALTKAGALSGRFRIRQQGTKFVTDAGETFIFKSKGGNLLIGIKARTKRGDFVGPSVPRAVAKGRGRNRELTVFYVLRRRVEVPARFGFIGSWKLLERRLLPKLVARETDLAFKQAKGDL